MSLKGYGVFKKWDSEGTANGTKNSRRLRALGVRCVLKNGTKKWDTIKKGVLQHEFTGKNQKSTPR